MTSSHKSDVHPQPLSRRLQRRIEHLRALACRERPFDRLKRVMETPARPALLGRSGFAELSDRLINGRAVAHLFQPFPGLDGGCPRPDTTRGRAHS